MKTQLKTHCDELLKAAAPVQASLGAALPELRAASSAFALDGLIGAVSTQSRSLEEWMEEVRLEEANLVIFGPLKSGKSVLMNAISGSYVSEVSSLPAYPCLVYVRNGEDPRFELTRYNGKRETFPDNAALQEQVTHAHQSLGAKIREAEERGETFEPEKHHPEAIRRVDIELPTTGLEQSGTVLVDTPGLYARMKFGYDRMTRHFRDRAACAVFVVRPENLFLEQVFNEFDELLSFFPRIFFVVNIDQSKQDLQADGSLRPSVESTAPGEIVRAFESLAMNAVIRRAYEEGRLQVYPVDLLEEASRVLRGEGEAAPAFHKLRGDLEDYLNGSDYVREFRLLKGRRLEAMISEVEGQLQGPSVRLLEEKQGLLEAELREAEACLEAVDELREVDWASRFKPVREKARENFEEVKADLRMTLRAEFATEIEGWLQSDESLSDLRWERLLRRSERCKERVQEAASHAFRAILEAPSFGVEWTSEEVKALEKLDALPLDEVRDEVLRESRRVDPMPFGDPTVDLPVRRAWWDWLLLRGAKRVRKSIFGPGENPRKPVPLAVKERRLGERSREFLLESVEREMIEPLVENAFAGRTEKIDSAARRLAQRATDRLGEIGESSVKVVEISREQLDRVQRIWNHLEALRGAIAESRKRLGLDQSTE